VYLTLKNKTILSIGQAVGDKVVVIFEILIPQIAG
jgi:hypothetical protein